VPVQVVFETHSITLDNERGIATGWLPGELSPQGRENARELGERRREDGIACVFTSDLRRAVETAELAFAGSGIEIRQDERLRECNYGDLNGEPVERLEPRSRFLVEPFPGGESYGDCVRKLRGFLADVEREFDGRRVLVIGHSAQRYALRNIFGGVPLKIAVDTPFRWQEGWEYVAPPAGSSVPKAVGRSYAALSLATMLSIYVGLGSAALGWRPGVFITIGFLTAQFLAHVALGVIGYRAVMSRPWPKVKPLEDGDW
jgi:broad specificity phosphatase PhoE